ncbi:FMN-binding protein [Streptomyces sp. NBC_00009]|uniref:FMN-binding protein n=1 Tax=Streptomyces sp. NBC_00009 TaxID=2975620 RepID=UPI00324DD51B
MNISVRKKALAAGAAALLSAGLAACSSADNDSASAPSSASASPSAPSPSASRTYRDGTYSADGGYGSQNSSIGVSVTLDNGVITDVEVTPHATNTTSRGYQERFADAVPDLVEGKAIDDVQLDRVAGSSGTPDGFNAAIDQIKDEAAASA